MVGLDAMFALEDVGPDRALAEEGDAVELAGLFGKDVDKLTADDFSFLLGIAHPCQLIEETVGGVHIDEIGGHLVAKHADDLFRFALAEQTVVDVHAGELLADGADQQRRDDGRVNAAGQGEKDLLVADLLTQHFDALVDVSLGQRGGVDALHAFGTGFQYHICILRFSFFTGLLYSRPYRMRNEKISAGA